MSARTPALVLFLVLLPLAADRGTPPAPAPDGPALVAPDAEAARLALEAKREKLLQRQREPERFDRPDEAAEFFRQQRLAPGQEELPLEHLHEQLTAVRAREAADALRRDATHPAGIVGWTAIGPGNIGGRTRQIVFDPVNPNVMYAAGVAGGVWKSTDGGFDWSPTDDFMLNLAVCALAIDPTNPNVLYAGTGEGFGTGRPFVRGLGIFKTTNAGGTWTQLAGTVSGVPSGAFYWVNEIVLSPNDPNRVYAATRTGVWRSLNGGATWSVVLSNPRYLATTPATLGCTHGCTDLAIRSDRNPDVLFAAFGSNEADGLYRSDDGGNSWVRYTTPSYQGRMEIAIAPSDNNRIYLTMADNGGLAGYGRIVTVYRSDDGLNFASVLDPSHPFSPWLFSYVSIATGCYEHPVIYSQGWYDNVIAVDPVNPDIVWVGGIDLFRSDDGGATFGIAGYWFYYTQDPQPVIYLHPDQHEITFHPGYDGTTNQIMFVGNDGGIFRTTNARAATSQEECPIGPDPGPLPDIVWENMNRGYEVTQFYHGDVAPTEDRFVGGAQDNGTSQATSATDPDAWDMIYGGDGGYVAIDPGNPQRFFIEIQGFPTFRVTTDGGQTFAPATTGITDTDGLFISPYAMDPSDPNVMFTGGSRPWRTTNGAASWQRIGPDFAGPNRISAVAVAPSDPNVVYLGFDNGYVVRTTNARAAAGSVTWSIFTNGLYGGWVSSVAVDPQDPNKAYITYSTYGIPHVLRTTNGGTSWTSIDGIVAAGVPDIPVHWIAVRPCDGQQLYAGTELGVFASENGGTTWMPANSGLAHTVVETLAFQGENRLVAFTHGRGVFRTDLVSCGATGAPIAAADADGPALAASPTPFRGDLAVRARLPRSGPARVTVHDAAGRLVAVLADGHAEAGMLERTWSGRNRSGEEVAAGVYFVRLRAEGVAAVTKVVHVR